MTRAIIGARVSVWKPGKTSQDEQYVTGERYATGRGWDIGGQFEDIDVSAIEVDPWSRPDLAPWLTEKVDQWEAIVFTKIDRAFRSIKDAVKFAEWIKDHGKILAFADDGILLDYSPSNGKSGYDQVMAELFLFLGAFFAQLEGQRFKKRALDGHSGLRLTNRWAGGQPPYGYKVVPHPQGGKMLAVDPVSSEAVKFAAKLLLEGKSLWEIADSLTRQGFPTPARYVAQAHTVETRSRRKTEVSDFWNQSSIGKILRSPATMGWKVTGRSVKTRRLVRGKDGLPIKMADGLFKPEEWADIQAKLEVRSRTKERSHGAAPLLGIVYCNGCKERLYRVVNTSKGKTYEYYRCVPKSGKLKCLGHSFKAADIQAVLDENMAFDMAAIPVTTQRFVPGEDHSQELDMVVKAMSDIRSEKDQGLYNYPGGDEEYQERLASLVTQRQALAALPYRPDEWIEEPTDETYAESYARMDPDERRALLLAGGIRLYVGPSYFHLKIPEDLAQKLPKLTA